jgi:hypothetical protein
MLDAMEAVDNITTASKSTEIITGTSSLNSLKSSITPTSSQITQEPVTTNPYVDTGQTVIYVFFVLS